MISCVSPLAEESYRKLCHIYGGKALANRVTMIPHPVESVFRYSGDDKRRQVVCVGRWQDDIQKRTWLLMEVIDSLIATDDRVEVVIVGNPSEELRNWHQSLEISHGKRVQLTGRTGRDALMAILGVSQVFYSPSSYESFGIAAAEALCSGCSVVAGRLITMPSFEWFVSENSGTLAAHDDGKGHAEALHEELESWARGERDARRISDIWSGRLHADMVAARVVEMMR